MTQPNSNPVFDSYSKNYESFHNDYLPPGVESRRFLEQKVRAVGQWLTRFYPGRKDVTILDFGCGNGRLAVELLRNPLIARYVGVDESQASIEECRTLLAPLQARARFETEVDRIPKEERFDMILAFNVFHHVLPQERSAMAQKLLERLAPGGTLVLWEHNPFNPVTRALVRWCPFDKGVKLLTLASSLRLFLRAGIQVTEKRYLNFSPPDWQERPIFNWIERRLGGFPLGGQYWVLFQRER